MLQLVSTTLLALAAAKQAAAHGGVLAYSWGGQWYQGFVPYNTPTGQSSIQREWDTYNPIQDATLSSIACNDPGVALALQKTGTVAAGTPITAYWNDPWPHPYGPMITYMANCGGDCTSANVNSLSWFKIDQAGLISGTVASGTWGDGQMIANNNSWTSTVPKCIPSGNYMIRFETIALHSQPAQFYPECAQLQVTGGGSTTPSGSYLAKFPGAYSNSDPGIAIDIYGQAAQTQTSYPIPGPPLFTCGGSSSGPTTTSTTSKSTTTSKSSTTSKPTSTSSTSSKPTTSTSTTTGGTVAHYGQCGGTGYSGPTTCAAPYTCSVINPYYSQCV